MVLVRTGLGIAHSIIDAHIEIAFHDQGIADTVKRPVYQHQPGTLVRERDGLAAFTAKIIANGRASLEHRQNMAGFERT